MRKRLPVAPALLVTLPVLAALIAGCNSASNNAGGGSGVSRLRGGGATFVQPIMEVWAYEYQKAKGVEIDYQAKGSGNGIQQMTEQTIQFGCSDAPMKKAQLEKAVEKGGEVIHIPLILGPVVLAYNVPGVDKQLVFDGKALADIYMGKITKWNDAALAALNPDVKLPDLAIAPVYRAEASGTTNIFKEFLAKSSPAFKTEVGVSTEPTWPKGVGTGEPANAGVANRVKSSAGALGYMEMSYAKTNNLAFARIKNRAGKAIEPSPASVTAAAAIAMNEKQTAEPYTLHELTFSLTDAAGDDSYPITGINYCVIYKNQKAHVGKSLKEFLTWVIHDGQAESFTKKLEYAPLPADLVKKIEARLEQIEMQ
jgi:phosphate ABC transporter phosphate-binding protein